MTDRGVAYNFWTRVVAEQAERGWTDVELQTRSGIPRGTVDRLAKGKRPPLARVVNALADTLGIDRTEAYRLAGRLPGDDQEQDEEEQPAERQISARDALLADPTYTDEQKAVILGVMDLISRGGGEGQERRAS